MSVRLRLTLLYSTILALTLLGLGAGLYFLVDRVTLNTLAETLTDEARQLTASRSFRFEHIGYRTGRLADPQTYFQTLRPDGQVADRSPNLGDAVLPQGEAGRPPTPPSEPWSGIVSTPGGRLLLVSSPVWIQGQFVGNLQVARSLVDHDELMVALRNILLSGGLVALVVTVGLGWALAGAALRPIDRITHTARAIGVERDFGRRVAHAGPNDEVGRLATTFNEMLTELQLAYQHLEQTLQAQRRFVADASHELRTPLTTIRGNLGLLERQPPIRLEDREAVVADAVEECDRLVRLVNNLLTLARADSGQVFALERVALAPLVAEVCRQVRILAPERAVECAAAPELAVCANPDALKQVILILVDNALKHTPPSAHILVTAQPAEAGVTLIVRDTGPGIPPEALTHIFERFYRVEASRSSPGTGLGLAIAKGLIEAQGGHLAAQSQVGQGTEFIISLPLA